MNVLKIQYIHTKNMVDNISKEKCTGCKLCGDICPQKAIIFETDAEGFWYPKIDFNK